MDGTLFKGWDSLMALATTGGLKVLSAIAIMVVGYFTARIVKTALMRAGRRTPQVDITIVAFVSSLAKYAVLAFTLVAVLSAFGVQTASVVAVIGAAGLAIGLALQGTLSHVAAGFMLILFRPFRVGDVIEIAGGVTGTVTEVSLFNTHITSPDNLNIIIPNNSLWSGVVKNHTTNPLRRNDLEVTITPNNDVEKAIGLIQDIVAADARILKQPEPVIGIGKQNEAGVKIFCQVWSKVPDMVPVQLEAYRAILKAFAEAGITAPPQAPRPPAEPRQTV